MPTFKTVVRHMWDKSRQYLRKMGGVILVASIIIWFLGYFPNNEEMNERIDNQIAQVEENHFNQLINEREYEEQVAELEGIRNTEHTENSYIGQIGKFIEPVMKPLGFDWKISVSLLTGSAAKEVIVSTLGVLYAGDPESEESSLRTRLLNAANAGGSLTFTPLVVISLLLFVLIYFPCVATVAAIKEEAGSWKWGVFSLLYTTILAWVVSFLIYQIGSLLI